MKILFKYFLFLFGLVLNAQSTVRLDSIILEGIKARDRGEYSKSLELLTEVRTVAEDKHCYKQQFLAINNIGANYYSMLDYGEALDNYLEAYTIALKHLNQSEEMIVLNNIAILYSKEGDLDKAYAYFSKAYALAKEHNENIKIGIYAVNLGIVATQQDKLDLAAAYLVEGKNRLKDEPSLHMLAEMPLAENYFKKGELHRAKALAEKRLPNLETIALSEEKVSILILLSNISIKQEDVLMAVKYAQTAIGVAVNPENRISAYNQLSMVYKEAGLVHEALESKDSIIMLTNSLNQLKNGRFFETNKVKFEIANYRRDLLQIRKKQLEERTMLYTILGILLLLIILSTWALRNSFIKNKQRKSLHDRSKEIIELELKKNLSDNLVLVEKMHAKESLALLNQEKLKNEIEHNNRKLAAKALQISSRNELLNEVINSLSRQTDVSRNVYLMDKVKELNALLKNDGQWGSFLIHFEEVNHTFISNLKKRHPELTTNDIRYISYLYMDLTNKEISSLFNISSVASRKRKERIISKMGLDDGIDIYYYFSTL